MVLESCCQICPVAAPCTGLRGDVCCAWQRLCWLLFSIKLKVYKWYSLKIYVYSHKCRNRTQENIENVKTKLKLQKRLTRDEHYQSSNRVHVTKHASDYTKRQSSFALDIGNLACRFVHIGFVFAGTVDLSLFLSLLEWHTLPSHASAEASLTG